MEKINVKYMYAVISLIIILFIILHTNHIDLNLHDDYSDTDNDEQEDVVGVVPGLFGNVEGFGGGHGGGGHAAARSGGSRNTKSTNRDKGGRCVIS